ncbi:olfactory receptor 8D1-like [Pleurodeles waltl]|uniref:olfactory receptor 8D1-like n=1 Tax=Pleurodeles waltl TaxID=8319 RepID=UPI003709B9D1
MGEDNKTMMEEFLLIGFSDSPHLQVPLFLAFLLIYLMTLVGNLLIMITIYSSSLLHSPMYIFLTNLSFLDITYTSVIFPQMLVNFFNEGTDLSLSECLVQMYFFTVMASTEIILLTLMAYDRYVAICNPLRYTVIMSKAVCTRLAAGCWTVGIIDTIPHTVLISQLSFCVTHTINHFFCDISAMMNISCSDTWKIEILTYVMGSIQTLMSFALIIISYVNIAFSVLKIRSKDGRHKAVSTCTSHLIVVILFYGSVSFSYMRPTSSYSKVDNKILSLSYIAVTPLCNPIIYSLKNTEFKNALRKKRNTA